MNLPANSTKSLVVATSKKVEEATTCLSKENTSSGPVDEKAMQQYVYPLPVARYEDVVANPKLFIDTIGNFHAAMGTKFMIPIIGGQNLDLHRLFVEVTSRGGFKKVLEEKKWKEVTYSFSFPPSATNASFILKKYYMSLLHHFEQVYYFNAKAWTPVSEDTWQCTKQVLSSTSEMNKDQLPLPECQIDSNQILPMKRQRDTIEDSLSKDSPEPSIGFPVSGIIDGKFDRGYLCTVTIGGELLQGVLFQPTAQSSYQPPMHHHGAVSKCQTSSGNASQPLTIARRRRRKKCEMKKRDPAHPKPNRSGYNFFFAEQHARLKQLHPGKDRDISRMIGELWNNISEAKKAVYQEKAMKDKERYRIEMDHYRETLIERQQVSKAAPLLQQLFNNTLETDKEASPQTPENEFDSSNDKISYENEAKIPMDVEIDPKNNMLLSTESSHPKPVWDKVNGPIITETVSVQESVDRVPDSNDETEKSNKNLDTEPNIFQLHGSKVTYGVQYGTLPSSNPESQPTEEGKGSLP